MNKVCNEMFIQPRVMHSRVFIQFVGFRRCTFAADFNWFNFNYRIRWVSWFNWISWVNKNRKGTEDDGSQTKGSKPTGRNS